MRVGVVASRRQLSLGVAGESMTALVPPSKAKVVRTNIVASRSAKVLSRSGTIVVCAEQYDRAETVRD